MGTVKLFDEGSNTLLMRNLRMTGARPVWLSMNPTDAWLSGERWPLCCPCNNRSQRLCCRTWDLWDNECKMFKLVKLLLNTPTEWDLWVAWLSGCTWSFVAKQQVCTLPTLSHFEVFNFPYLGFQVFLLFTLGFYFLAQSSKTSSLHGNLRQIRA